MSVTKRLDESAWFAANRAVRLYNGPFKSRDGRPHPEWQALLRRAAAAEQDVHETRRARRAETEPCPYCGRTTTGES